MELVAAPACASSATRSAALYSSSSRKLDSTRVRFLGSKLHPSSLAIDFRPQSRSVQVRAAKKTFGSFDDLLKNSEVPVLVDFYATWCGPCQFMVPILAEVQAQMKDELLVVKIDSEKYSELSSKYAVEALPTFILFKNGSPIDRFEGAMPTAKLVERIRQVLSSCKAGV